MKKVGLTLSLLIVFSTLATAQPSGGQESTDPGLLPGDLFYPVETLAENLEVKVAGVIGGSDFKAKALANNAEESLAEANILAERNDSKKASEMTEKYFKQMNNSRKLAENSKNTNLSSKLDGISRKNVERLEKVKENVPEQAKKGIEKAIEKTNRSIPQERPSNDQKPDIASKKGSKDVNISGKKKGSGKAGKGLNRSLKEDINPGNRRSLVTGKSDNSSEDGGDILNSSRQEQGGNNSDNSKTEESPGSTEEVPESDSSKEEKPDQGLDENRLNESGKNLSAVPVV